MNNGRADDALPLFFMVSADIQIIKREARTQLFIIDQSSVSIYFSSDPPPLRNLLHWPAAIISRWLISVIITALYATANKKG
jgi:hypothetical protein